MKVRVDVAVDPMAIASNHKAIGQSNWNDSNRCGEVQRRWRRGHHPVRLRPCGRETFPLIYKKEQVVKISKIRKTLMLAASPAVLFGLGGGCLPENVFAETAGQIVNGLIVTAFNMFAAGSGVQI